MVANIYMAIVFPFLNLEILARDMMEVMRLIIAGTEGAGKSAFIRNISELKTISSSAGTLNCSMLSSVEPPMDFGRIQFSPGMILHMYATPSSSRLDFMGDMLIRKAHASVLLVPSHRPAEFRRTRSILNSMQQLSDAPMLIGLTHQDHKDAWSARNIEIALGSLRSYPLPRMETIDANDRRSVTKALIVLLSQFSKQNNIRFA